MEILIAFVMMLCVALVAGVLLLIFSHFFEVKKNTLEKNIRDRLPGINCGACGYKGCDDYASALTNNGAKPNLCIPGSQKVAKEICSILGIKQDEEEPVKDVVAFVKCNGNCDATYKKAQYEGIMTCSAATMLYGGPNACHFGCLGLGDCSAVCPSNAICLSSGIAYVDTSRCLGCGLCEKVCPKNIITMLPQDAKTAVFCNNKQKGADAIKVCKNACIGCKKCEKKCPNDAIKVINNLAVIDYSKCTYCGICTEECPTKCLKKVFFEDLPNGYSSDLIVK